MVRKKILQVITKADWAGAQKVLFEIVKSVKEKYDNEFEMDVAVGIDGPLVSELKKIGIKVYILKHLKWNFDPIEDMKSINELKKLIKTNKYDVVHLHSSKAGFNGRIAAKLAGVKKIIYTVHGWWGIERFKGLEKKIILNLERFAANFCNYIVLINEKDLKYAKENKIGRSHQYKLIYNDVSVPEVKKGILRKKLNIDDNVKIIGNVGRLDEQKNPFRFLNIANKVLEKDSSFLFVWIGDGKLKEEINNLVFDREKIKFLGFIKDPYEYIKDFDLFLMTSDLEGTPLTVIEALKLGVPVISTDVGGISEIIGKNNTFEINDIDSAVNMILNWDFNKNVDYKYCDMVKRYVEIYRM